MTTTFFLVRHAAHDNVGGFLAGRKPGVLLGEAGVAQAIRLGERMRRERFDAIHASPRERTQQTAAAIADACGHMKISTTEALDEIDFGEWSGRSFEQLNTDERWGRWNAERSRAQTPAGETMAMVQDRVLELMRSLAEAGRERALVLVSHADVIKAAVCHVLGLSLDAWPRFEVSPASVTTVAMGEWGTKLLGLNEVVS